ncbi:putative quinol monooxygenase [Streptomyces sp. NPDC058045]|uniref:putative quinol monooxygenase n=1 Tax=Streptomyces sp. NPDC058045 TaxID=3346311 RepID=UPI0036E94482
MVIVYGGISVDPSRVEDVVAAGTVFQQASAAEDGCLEYQLSWKVGEPENLRLLELWSSVEAHEAHRGQQHTKEWTEFISAAATAPPKFTRHEVREV